MSKLDLLPINIAGEWRLGGGDESTSLYPATGEVVGRLRAPSLADVAMVGYTSQAHLAGLPLPAAYPRVAAWVARLQALPGYVPLLDHLSGVPPQPAEAA